MGIFTDLKNAFSDPSSSQKPSTPLNGTMKSNNSGLTNAEMELEKVYNLYRENWYTAKPYGFKLNTRDGKTYVMFLPISPSNITISTPFATNIVTTLYGTVEEHSNNRYYDIVIEGTTGMAPKFVAPLETDNETVAYDKLKKPGRASFPIATTPLGGFFQNTVAQAINVYRQASKITEQAKSLYQGVTGKSSDEGDLETALYIDQTGYAAFHNLYRFFMKYKSDVAGVDSSEEYKKNVHPLIFFNYKDNNQYNVAIKNFSLRRSSESPMLYFYSITMRGYYLQTVGRAISTEDTMLQRLEDLGLNGVQGSTVFSQLKGISGTAKNIVGSLQGGVKIFGS